ncbi:hypothetical protein HBB16_10170 [Pseudonocardia sp. MCCB 268]|nr:hypothetical protein [Pseudonocardia cytotoxica]
MASRFVVRGLLGSEERVVINSATTVTCSASVHLPARGQRALGRHLPRREFEVTTTVRRRTDRAHRIHPPGPGTRRQRTTRDRKS